MHGIRERNWKKTIFFGIGLIACIIAVIVVGMSTYRTGANQLSADVSELEEADMRIDVKVHNGLVDPEIITNLMALDVAVPSDNQQTETSATSPTVQVQVDGTSVTVPEDGSVRKVIKSEDGTTSIDVSSQSSMSSGTSRTRSSINIDTDSSVRIRSKISE